MTQTEKQSNFDKKKLKSSPNRQDAYQLLHDGSLALAQVEANGMKIDMEYVAKAMRKTKKKINYLKEEIEQTKEVREWKAKYRKKFNLTSTKQLADMLFNEWGFTPEIFTGKGDPATSVEALEILDIPFVQQYFPIKRLIKAQSTYLRNLVVEEVNGFIHPFFNLHLVISFRSSSSSPNFQNIPVREPTIKKLIRRAFIPRKGQQLVEIDFSGIEVSVACCFHKDPNMLSYIKDKTKDMHRDMAMQCYKLPIEEVTRDIRYCGKNKFVFPQFYGDYYLTCAKNLWSSIDGMNLKTVSGIPLKEHLESVGISLLGACNPKEETIPGTFEHHIKNVEKDFWENRFPVYTAWKKKWYAKYQANGSFDSLTGFRYSGYMKRNEVINYAVQGSAFHCLLWCLIRLNAWLADKKSCIVGQIHDSVVADVHPDELEDYIAMARKIMTEEILEHWRWIIVPFEVEVEVAPIDGSWYEKEEI